MCLTLEHLPSAAPCFKKLYLCSQSLQQPNDVNIINVIWQIRELRHKMFNQSSWSQSWRVEESVLQLKKTLVKLSQPVLSMESVHSCWECDLNVPEGLPKYTTYHGLQQALLQIPANRECFVLWR